MRIASRTFVLGAVALSISGSVACGGGGGGAGGSASSSASSTSTTTSTSTSSSTSASSGGPTWTQACADQAHASCTRRDTCSLAGADNARVYGSEAICEARSVLECDTGFQAKGTGQTAAHIEACVAAYPGYPCADFFDNTPPAACVPPAGTLAMGTACGTSSQCASTFCAVPPNATCGTCQPLPTVGAACQAPGDCGRDLACAIPATATTGTCAEFVPIMGACLTGTAPCQSGFACVGEVVATGTMGKCQQQATTVGAMCDGARKTMANCSANLGLACLPTSTGSSLGTCQTENLVGAGAACGPMGMPVTALAVCNAGGLCVNKVCVAAAADSAPCDSDITKGPPCLQPARCVPTAAGSTAGICTVPDITKCM